MSEKSSLEVNHHILTWGERTYVMGILNITPDSFSGDGLLEDPRFQSKIEESQIMPVDLAIQQAGEFVAEGVDILDIGGESTRPGSNPIAINEEIDRVVPIISALSHEFDVILSVDTYKSEVAQAALEAGAHMVNDVWGLKVDHKLGEVAAEFGVPIVLMHNRSSWTHAQIKERLGGRYIGVPYDDLLADIQRELLESVSIAKEAGISDDHIILDPGIGFGKTVEQNLELLNRLDEIKSLGYPVLFGPSRKSFIGYTLDLPVNERLEGTAAAVVVGIVRGADIIRVHDVSFMGRVARMTDAIVRSESVF